MRGLLLIFGAMWFLCIISRLTDNVAISQKFKIIKPHKLLMTGTYQKNKKETPHDHE